MRNGLTRKSTAPAFMAATAISTLPVGGEKHDRKLYLGLGEFLLQFKPAYFGHAHVEDYAA